MSVMSMLPVPVIQMGLVEKLVEVEQNQPHVQQLVAQESARLAIKAQAERVPVVDSSGQGKKVHNRDPEREKKEQRRSLNRSSHEAVSEEPSAQDDDELAASNPWTGQIVNMKV
jgi:hypothetical protein